MPDSSDQIPALPLDAQGILELAARSMFQLFSTVSQGMFLVDLRGRIVWVNEGYQRFLPDLGLTSVDQFVGHTVEEVIPNTQMRRVLETGQPVLIDLLTNRAGTFVVSRIPLRDDAGKVIGAIGIVLYLAFGGTLALLIALTRWPKMHLISNAEWFYRLVGAHGAAMLIFWILFFEVAGLLFGGSILLSRRLTAPKMGWLAQT